MPVAEEEEEEEVDSVQHQGDLAPDSGEEAGDPGELAGVTLEHTRDRTAVHPTGGAMVVLLDEEHPVQMVLVSVICEFFNHSLVDKNNLEFRLCSFKYFIMNS